MFIRLKKAFQLIGILIIGIFLVTTVVGLARNSSERVRAAGPIPPPVGAPKLSLSTKTVTPTLTSLADPILTYSIVILNTGAYTASQVTLSDSIPPGTTYNNDAWSSVALKPTVSGGVLTWGPGVVGFDDSVEIRFSVTIAPGFVGDLISNTATINCPDIPAPVTVSAKTRVTDHPVFEITKRSTTAMPGPNQPLTYELTVTNVGQDAVSTPITVKDQVPANTTFLNASDGGSLAGGFVNWNPTVDLQFEETATYTFSVKVGNVPSGTVIANQNYLVEGPEGTNSGEPVTSTVVDPSFILSKSVEPDPPGSNREMTYTLTVLNLGSRATDLIVYDTVPDNVEYVSGGTYSGNPKREVTWIIPSLDTRESAQVSFTVYIADIADVPILNEDYHVCSDNGTGVCADGLPVSSLVAPPAFKVTASLDPIAKGAGGGTKDVTPTLTIENLGPGNAIDATALFAFNNIQVSSVDFVAIPNVGTITEGPACNPHCVKYIWEGDISASDIITFTTIEGQNSVGGDEGTHYTATVVVNDLLGDFMTEPITATAVGVVTHHANLIPTKSAPALIGAGDVMTYNIQVVNSAYTTELAPPPLLRDTLPAGVTLQSISDGGKVLPGSPSIVEWTLPAMGPGETIFRSFDVLVDEGLVSGTLIINDDYRTSWYESEVSGGASHTFYNIGEPVTTTVREVGLIDSYKTVTPTWALPGEDIELIYVVHVVNSSPNLLEAVELSDIFPWESSTYQRNAVASAGTLTDDIVSLDWIGDLAPNSEELITFTVKVDDFYEGMLTNTATISHDSLQQDKVVSAVAYITDQPVLEITKEATPSPVEMHGTLLYQIHVTNLAQQATMLKITDTIPANTTYVEGSASSGGKLVNGSLEWIFPVLNHGDTLDLTFQVVVNSGKNVTNDTYSVSCDEGVSAYGDPVVTPIKVHRLLLPLVHKR